MKYTISVRFIERPNQCPFRDDEDKYPFEWTTNKCRKCDKVCDAKEEGIIPEWCPLHDVKVGVFDNVQ